MRSFLAFIFSFFFAASSLAQTATQSVLYTFKDADPTDDPITGLIQATDGNFYGAGGSAVYEVTPSGTYKVVHTFATATEGSGPESIIQGPDGYLYGLNSTGGTNGYGTIYKMSLSGQVTVLYTFNGTTDGGSSEAGLILGSDGNFYGAATNGTSASSGTLFKLTPTGTYTVLYTFTGLNDGGNPYANLLQASDGNFYGVAANGGPNGAGVLFQLTPAGIYKVVHAFTQAETGGDVEATLVQGADGALYGSTFTGGSSYGIIYKVTLDGTLTTVYTFTNGTDTSMPRGALLLASDGNFYGGTAGGNGVIFKLTPTGTFSTIYSFVGPTDGKRPYAGVIQGGDGNFYGVATFGGSGTDGTVYKLAFSPAMAAPIQITPASTSVPLGSTVKLSWTVAGAYSLSAQQCFATTNGDTAGSGWSGILAGTLTAGVFGGSSTVTTGTKGSVTYVLTCGGTEMGSTTITVTDPLPISITTNSLPNGTVGIAYSTTLAATGGVTPYTWSISSGSLPAGLTISPSTGVISGTPTANGVFQITIGVADAESTPLTATAALSLTVSAAAPTVVATPTTVSISAPGGSGSTSLSLSGFSNTSISFSCSGLPHGASCSAGAISGSGAAGTATLTITTSAPATAQLHAPGMSSSRIVLAFAFPGLALLLGFSRRRRLVGVRMLAVATVMLLSFGLMSGCGNGSSTTSTPDQGTPAGASAITVSATSGSQTATTTITLNVQ